MSDYQERYYKTEMPESDLPVKGFVDFMQELGTEIKDRMNVYEVHYEVKDEELSIIVSNGSPEELDALENVHRVGLKNLEKMSEQLGECSADEVWLSKKKEFRKYQIDYLDPVVSVEPRVPDFNLKVKGEGLSYPNNSITDRLPWRSNPETEPRKDIRIEASDPEKEGWKEVVSSLELESASEF